MDFIEKFAMAKRGIENLFDFPFELVIKDYRRRGRLCSPRNI
jgi:hypothetical protein